MAARVSRLELFHVLYPISQGYGNKLDFYVPQAKNMKFARKLYLQLGAADFSLGVERSYGSLALFEKKYNEYKPLRTGEIQGDFYFGE
jgi:hypothetical protein